MERPDPQPHACAFSVGGKERIKNLVRLLRWQPHSCIADRDQHLTIRAAPFETRRMAKAVMMSAARSRACGQAFDDAEPVPLILPAGFMRFVPNIADHLVRKFWVKTRDTPTIHSASVPYVFPTAIYRALRCDRCLVITT